MWQEQARLEAQMKQILALSARDKEPASQWWACWRRGV
jgi:hypothetical protein